MGISILDNFDYRAGKPNFTRDLFATVEEMVAFPEMYLPSVFECNVTDTGDRYRYNVNNDVDPVTGKWRLVTGGTGGSVDGYTKGEVNTLLNKKLDKPETDGTEGQVLTVQADGTNAYADVPTYDDTDIKELINKKIDKPEIEGTVGQVLTVQEDGTNAYADVPQYDDAEIKEALNKKLDKPEIGGTVGQVLTVQEDGTNAYADVPTYDDTELRELIGDIPIGNLNYEIVETLPEVTSDEAKEHTLYMIKSESDDTGYNQYIIVDGAYKKVGSTTSGTGGASTASEVSYSNETLSSVLDVKMALDTIIAKIYYVAPSITSFTCNPSRTAYEIGEKITSITFTWAYNKEIVSQSLTGCAIELSDRTATYSTELTSNKTFTLTASDGTNNATSSKSFTFNNKVHHGSASIPASYDSAFILSLSGALKGNKNGTYTTNVGAGQYFYIAMPTSYNNADVLTGKIGGFDTDFSKVATIEHTNVSGYKTNYNIYKSTNSNLGNITMTI